MGKLDKTLYEELERIRNIRNPEELNEKTIQTALILPLLRALKWNTSNPYEVILEHTVGQYRKGNVDIALMQPGSPLAFIESKAASVDLRSNSSIREQILYYCREEHVNIGVLTNGIVWEFYYVENTPTSEKNPPPAEVVNIKEDDISELINCFTRLLSRDSLFDNKAKENLRYVYEQKHIQIVWNDLLRDGDERIASALRSELRNRGVTTLNKDLSREYVREQFKNYQSGTQNLRVQETPIEIVSDSASRPEDKIQKESKSRKPLYIVAFGKRRNVKTWQQVKTNFIGILVEQYPELLNGRLFELCDKKRKEFVVRGDQLDRRKFLRAREIDSKDIWIEANKSANHLVADCRIILRQLGMNEDELKIVCDDADLDRP